MFLLGLAAESGTRDSVAYLPLETMSGGRPGAKVRGRDQASSCAVRGVFPIGVDESP